MDLGRVIGSLGTECRLIVESSPSLARDVHMAAKAQAKANDAYGYRKTPVALKVPFSDGLMTSPAQVLHELGVATTFFTRSPFAEVARHWAQARYCGTLTSSRGRMALSTEADELVYHHKVTQSEQLGVGLALVVAKEVLQRTHPGWEFGSVDAEITLKAGAIAGALQVSQAKGTKKRPDYFLVGRRLGGRDLGTKVVVLECKGTHLNRQYAIHQLATACVQVETVEVGGRVPTGLMVASQLSPDGITSYVLDPPGDDDLWSGPEDELDELLNAAPEDVGLAFGPPSPEQIEARRAALAAEDDEDHALRNVPPGDQQVREDAVGEDDLPPGVPHIVQIPDERRGWFLQVLARTAAASALLFAGYPDTATAYATPRQRGINHPLGQDPLLEPESEQLVATARATSEVIDGQQFRGTSLTAPIGNGTSIEMFRGVETGLYELLVEGRVGRYFRSSSRPYQRWSDRRSLGSGSRDIVSIGRDGTALRIRLTG